MNELIVLAILFGPFLYGALIAKVTEHEWLGTASTVLCVVLIGVWVYAQPPKPYKPSAFVEDCMHKGYDFDYCADIESREIPCWAAASPARC